MLQGVNIEEIKKYNASLKQCRDRAASLNAEIEYTNKEIDNIKTLLDQIPSILSVWWRCGIITFHSLEDRLVKQWFKTLSDWGEFSLLYKKAVQPTYQEVQKNRPSRSAKYRVIERKF